MTGWQGKIIDAFIARYFDSAPGAEDDRNSLRLRSAMLFPDFDSASPDEKESYLESAEELERKGVVKLRWEKHGKGERLVTLACDDFEKLFAAAGRPYPKIEAGEIRAMLGEKVRGLQAAQVAQESPHGSAGERVGSVTAFLEFLSLNFGTREIGQGLDRRAVEEFVRLLEFICENHNPEKMTTRALSILLYKDSKHLEKILALCKPLLSRAQKPVSPLDLSFLERSYPEILISGKIIAEFKGQDTPLVNAGGHILGLPLESAQAIAAVRLLSGAESGSGENEKTVLTIENKETFYALHNANKDSPRYDCLLYIGGYSNRAAAALVKTLATSGFAFFHAGDLDPDGILILQHVREIAERPVVPVKMDGDTFDKYVPWARTLTKPMLRQMERVSAETKAIPGISDLMRRIEAIGKGVEQEIVDYG